MAKAQSKKQSNLVKWMLGAGVLVIGYLVLNPAQDATVATATKTAAKKKANANTDFTPADYEAATHPYPPLKQDLVDAFKPVIVQGGEQKDKNGFPGGFDGPGWSYSGMAVVDGVGEGVLDNATTGETVLLKRGQKWGSGRAGDIYPNSMVLIGRDGPVTVHVQESDGPSKSASVASTLPAPSMAPPMMMPQMSGAIGAGMPDMTIQADGSTGGYGGGGRRGRGRGRRNAGN